jgi:DNA-directed RNA polymerase I, II, and III subunit RPABC5
MIIPIRCFTCGKVLADKWAYYKRRCLELEQDDKPDASTSTTSSSFFEPSGKGAVLDELGLVKVCCRRHMLGHVDLIESL